MFLKQLVSALLALCVLLDIGVAHAAPIPAPQAQGGQGMKFLFLYEIAKTPTLCDRQWSGSGAYR